MTIENKPHQGFEAKVLHQVENRPGTWNSLHVGVFQGDEQIGSYQRNYSSLYETFFPFRRGQDWYALYSPQYTATQIMRLPDCVHIGGEEPQSNGFCPVEYYVPAFRRAYYTSIRDEAGHIHIVPGGSEMLCLGEKDVGDLWNLTEEESEGFAYGEVEYLPFGFVAGCHWGDDSSWKIQVLDLREPEKPLRLDTLGYLELPEGMRLRDAVVIHDIEPDPESEWVVFDLSVRRRVSFYGESFTFKTWEG